MDHTNSPGIPESFVQDAIRAGVPLPLIARGGKKAESATVTCSHCGAIVILNPDRKRPRGYCWHCDHYVCDNPRCGLECKPFQAKLDALHHLASVAPQEDLPGIFQTFK